MPLLDYWCPECDESFEAVVSRADDDTECPHCYAEVARGPRGDPPSARVRLRAQARCEGREDAEGEDRMAHLGGEDPGLLCDLDWEHQGTRALHALYLELRESASLPPWDVLEPELREVYEAAFINAVPEEE